MSVTKINSVFKANGMRKLSNWLINQHEFKKRAITLRSYPVCADIEVSNVCLLSCIHCPRTYRNINNIDLKVGLLSVDKFADMASKLLPVRHLTLHGLGEPLRNTNIFKMIELAHKQGFSVSFSTAASLYNPDIEEGLYRNPPDSITFSVDSVEKASFEAIRVGHNLEMFLSNLENMISVLRRSGRNIDILFQCCVMKINAPHLTKIIEFADKIKIRRVCFSELNLSYLGSVKDKLLLDSKDYVDVQEALLLAADKGIQSAFTRVYDTRKPDKLMCWYLWQQPYITWEGYVTICCGRPFSTIHNMGNIFEVESFMEIWNSPKMEELRKAVRSGDIPPICSACPMAG